MTATIHITGIVGQDTILLDVIRQFKSYDSPTDVKVIIDSVGGDVDTGQSIFSYLRNLELPITTVAVKAYSIAATIFMAGDRRVVMDGDDRVMIHMPFGVMGGNSEAFETTAKQLRKIENEFVDFYSVYTETDKDTIRKLLENETFLSASEAKDLNLSTEIEVPLKAVAFYNETEKPNKSKMTKAEKFIEGLKALLFQDANGDEIDVQEAETMEEIEEGQEATDAEGAPLSGEFTLTDGRVLVIEGGVISEVREAEQSEDEAEEILAAEISEISKWEISVVQDTFEIGTKIEYKPTEEGEEPTSVGAGEYELEDGRKILTDSEGIIRFIKETEEVEAQAQDETEPKTSEIVAKFEAYTAEIKALKELIGSDEPATKKDAAPQASSAKVGSLKEAIAKSRK